MAIVPVDSSTKDLQFETIPLVDLGLLSQSELNSLSLCSYEAFDLRRCDDVVIPKIDRSVFNESAGSRKQTYSRLRLAPRKPEITNVGRRRRCAGLLPLPKHPPNPVDDPERKENQRIATLLRELLVKDNSVSRLSTDLIVLDSEHKELPIQPQALPLKVVNGIPLQHLPVVVACKEVKKRGRKRKHELKPPLVHGDGNSNVMTNGIVLYDNGLNATKEQTMEIVNQNGVAVDIVALANVQDPFGPELRRRTVGLETEAALLGYLKDLKGQWGSRRKKRKIVDASDFGDMLPNGWKLLLTLKRREGRVWLHCRRYISPNGHQFVTSKEVSSYLLSYFGPQDPSLQNSGHSYRNTPQTQKLVSESTAGPTRQDEKSKEDSVFHSTSLITAHSNDHEKQVALLGIENLAEVQVRDLLECHKCNMAFEEKDSYLQHLLSSHQKSRKRSRIGSSISDGVIVKDGKYECQFCHKIFEERHRYNGHVGIHVRNYVRNLEVLPGPITFQKRMDPSSSGDVPCGVHLISSSVYINKRSIPETSAARPNYELNAGSVHCKPGVVSTRATADESNREGVINSSYSKQVTEADKSSIPEVPDVKMNELNVVYLHAKLEAASILEIPNSESICELNGNSSHSKQVAETYKESIPHTTDARLNDGEIVYSLRTEQDPTSILGSLPGAPKYEPNVASQGNVVKESGKEYSLETSATKPHDVQNTDSFHTKVEEVPVQETPSDVSNFQPNVGSCRSKLISEPNNDPGPETSAAELFEGRNVGTLHNILDEIPSAKSKCDLNASSSHNKHVMEARTTEGSLVEKSHIELFCDSKGPDSKSRTACEVNDFDNGKSSSCLDSTVLSNQMECSTFETCDGFDGSVVTSIKNDKCSIELERLSGSSSLTPGNEQIHGFDGNMSELITSVTEGPKLGEMDKFGNNKLESGFGSCDAGTNTHVRKTTWTVDDGNVPEDGVAGFSLPLKQSSACNNEQNAPEDRVADYSPLKQSSACNDEVGSDFGSCDAGGNKDVVTETTQITDEGNVPESAVADSCCFPDPNMTLDKGADEFCNIQRLENKSSFEEPRLDDIEPSQFSFLTGKESRSLPKKSFDFAYDAALEQRLDSTVQFEREAVYPAIASTNQPTTVCVWCRIEFNHEAGNLEMQPDSFGFMCQACKAKISGQVNALDTGLPKISYHE